MNSNMLRCIGPGFLNQVPTLLTTKQSTSAFWIGLRSPPRRMPLGSFPLFGVIQNLVFSKGPSAYVPDISAMFRV